MVSWPDESGRMRQEVKGMCPNRQHCTDYLD